MTLRCSGLRLTIHRPPARSSCISPFVPTSRLTRRDARSGVYHGSLGHFGLRVRGEAGGSGFRMIILQALWNGSHSENSAKTAIGVWAGGSRAGGGCPSEFSTVSQALNVPLLVIGPYPFPDAKKPNCHVPERYGSPGAMPAPESIMVHPAAPGTAYAVKPVVRASG